MSITATATATTTCKTWQSKFSLIPNELLQTYIFPRLDGCTLASLGCTTPELHTLIFYDEDLWFQLCHSTWPSTTSPRIRHLISTFPKGPRTFFSLSYPPLPYTLSPNLHPPSASSLPSNLISAVDIFHGGKSIFSKVQESETVTSWFKCSPFRVDLLNPKESIPMPICKPTHEDTCQHLYLKLELKYLLIHPARPSSINVSSLQPVSVKKHWLSNEVHVRYATVVDHVMFIVDVTCVECEPNGRVLHVTEVCLKMEGLDGAGLIGKDSLVILQRVFNGKTGNCENGKKVRINDSKKRYFEFLERGKELKDKKLMRERRLDIICMVFGIAFVFTLFCWSIVLALLLKVMSMRPRVRFNTF